MKSIAILAAFGLLPFSDVLADSQSWAQCSCSVWTPSGGWGYDWQLTYNACINNYDGAIAKYDHTLGRCTGTAGNTIDGARWFGDCQIQASDGYFPVTYGFIDMTQPVMTEEADNVRGYCTNSS
ncbi:hypothetical protein OIDMADRAFT_55288 [Oidiodendron maius Zn]|uniref:Cyanovirin-N domain-containing protein n=1 Tax=Oidiodendron maius (strain Zn) TaxID=913774 RepID=A0A0C3GXE2_OIDMZ|nr:hypothetical protein OIDMADRAFT_55288 [Oidiodendron maius Zn]